MKEDSELYTAKCGKCGAVVPLPFAPRDDRPMLCPACFFALQNADESKDESEEDKT